MAMRRVLYLGALCVCGVFYVCYQEWFSKLLLWTMVLMPWISLLISLPAIVFFHATWEGATAVAVGTPAFVRLKGGGVLPIPPYRARVRVCRRLTGDTWQFINEGELSTAHCGALRVTVTRVWVYEYLGLIGIPLRRREERDIPVRPKPLTTPLPSSFRDMLAQAWRPKAGGGFSEQHELRPYRPGDNLNQIHWKLTAKTGDLILREPMQPEQERVMLTVRIGGTAEELDRLFGRLLFLGQRLSASGLAFDIGAETGDGMVRHTVVTEDDLERAIDALLCCAPVQETAASVRTASAARCCHVGGEPDEA